MIAIEAVMCEPPPEIGSAIDTAFIQGVGHVDNEFIIILNINKILSGSELLELQAEVAQGQ